jgi:hypothetical protein
LHPRVVRWHVDRLVGNEHDALTNLSNYLSGGQHARATCWLFFIRKKMATQPPKQLSAGLRDMKVGVEVWNDA